MIKRGLGRPLFKFIIYLILFIKTISSHNKTEGGGIMQNYEEVPTMISGKDLDYLSDIYNWNFNACKLANHFEKEVQDEEIKELLEKIADMHKEYAKAVLNILN